MVGVEGGWVKFARGMVVARALAVAVALSLVAGCFWRSYPERIATHADVLVSMARKGVDLLAADRMTAGTLPELIYPLERGQALAAEARRRSGSAPPPSLVAFEALLRRYRTFCEEVDRLRRERPGSGARAALGPALHDVERAAADVHDAVAAG